MKKSTKYLLALPLLVSLFSCLGEEPKPIINKEINIQETGKLDKVYAYRPAPGQSVNVLPKYEKGDTELTMVQKVKSSLDKGELITLGGFGGYIILEYDPLVKNHEGEDFQILGNAFNGSSEAGIISVAYDDNGNGYPDPEEWYELKGSASGTKEETKGFSMTYFKPNPSSTIVAELEKGIMRRDYIKWINNQGEEGYIPQNIYHEQSYYPLWIKDESYTLSGTRLKPMVSHINGIYKQIAFEWGYVDSRPNDDKFGSRFDLDNAIDKEGKAKQLKAVRWIKVHSAVDMVLPFLGETSTEIMGVKILEAPKKEEKEAKN